LLRRPDRPNCKKTWLARLFLFAKMNSKLADLDQSHTDDIQSMQDSPREKNAVSSSFTASMHK
jgi:hypothetical protein